MERLIYNLKVNILKIFLGFFRNWLPLAVATTLIFGTIYAVMQQNYRQNANDPQIEIVEDVISSIEAGTAASAIISPSYSLDISKSLSSFIIIFDDSSKVVASSAQLDGKTPEVPGGVFDFVRKHGEERLTWEPREDVRIAAVLKKYDKGYVLAGRSIREVEKREKSLLLRLGLAWAFTVGAIFVTVLGLEFVKLKLNKRGE